MIQTTMLPNGIRVVTDSSEMADSVSLGVWVAVGARYETADINGISHCLEHMAFKGTQKRTAFEISKEIEDVGGMINAYTSRNMTAYYVRVLKENMHLGLDIISDITQNPIMDKEELEKEKGVIIQEINMKNDAPDELVSEYYMETAYPHQPLGRSIAGTAETVRRIDSQKLLDYMHTQYTANRMIISASGAVQHDEFVADCARLFTHVSTHQMPKAKSATYHSGEKRVIKPHEQVNLMLGYEGFSYTHPDYYTGIILASILGGGMSSRLCQEIREKRGLVYTIDAFNMPELDTGVFAIYAGTGEKEVAELMPVLCDELIKLPDTLTEEEINRAKACARAGILMQQENISSHARMNAIDLIIRGRIVPKEEVVEKINQIQKADLKRIAHQLLAQTPTFSAVGPIKQVMPYEDILARLKVGTNAPLQHVSARKNAQNER